ncbi:MAG: PKD domain-containing protein [Candidatus Poseidoniia archaeon]|jgi:PKD repeat protein|nr:PKD domain-containing protein [Candidatus Poseidoniia archaeon]
MFSNKRVAWAILAAFLLSSVPTVTAGGDYDEWFWDITGDTTDEDGDGYNDTATIGYDPDTTCECDVDIYVYITVYDSETGDEVDSGSFEYTINNGEGDWFEEDWTPDYNGTFDFNITLYDDEGYLEDYADWYDVELWAMTGSTDETINVDNAVTNDDEDTLMNDFDFWAHTKNDDIEGVNITVWKKNLLGQWDFYDNGTTDDAGELNLNNVTSGDYMWAASFGGEDLTNEGGYAVVDQTYTTGHIGVIDDWDGVGDYDDFVVLIPEGNGSRDDGYVEIYDEDENLIDDGTTDDESFGDYNFFVSYDLEQGNYTHYIYKEQDGDLLQNGSFYSYGSTDNNTDEWFAEWDHSTEDTNEDDQDDTINIYFDPETECDCEVDVEVYVDVYENDTGDWIDYTYGEYTINGTADDWFKLNWTATENGSYDFQVSLWDEDDNYEDEFEIDNVYLTNGGGGGGGQGDEDEWFYDWDYSTEDTNEDDEDDTIIIGYDPDTTCDCYVNITVYVDVYDNETGDWVDYTNAEHTIYDEEGDWFEQDWTATDNGSYDFFVDMYDEDWNQEDDFWIYNVSLTSGSGGGTGDEDEWFYDWDYETEDARIEIRYDPDTTCDCEVDITVYVDVYDNETSDYVDWTYAEHTIYDEESDDFAQDWTADENGTYDFNVSLYDEDYNLEDWFWIYNVSLSEGGGGTGDEDEWFDEWDYETEDARIEISYDPDTSCDCYVDIEVYIDVFDNETGDYVDSLYDDHTIYNEEEDWFGQDWTYYEGTYDFNVYLYDQEYGHEEDNFWIYGVELTEAEQNAAPVIDALNVADGDEGAEVSLSVDAHDDDDDNLTYSWDFGDGETASGENVKHTWADDGDYTVTVTVSDGEEEDSESATVSVTNVAPTLSVDGASSGQEAQARTFEADTSDVEADTVSVTWDFGDGETGSGDEVTYAWTDDGTYTVTVTASDEDGGETTETFNISISNRAPTLQVSASATSGDEGDSFAFSAVTSDVTDDTVSVTWDFGDGQTANGLAVTHTFTDDGTFVVEVIASDEDGGVTSEKVYLDIANVAPSLTNLQLPPAVRQGEDVTITIEATDPGDDEVTITWNMGDGTTYEGGTVTHTYSKSDTYTVTVCATDDDGGEDCQQATIPIELLEQLEEEGGLLPGFSLLSAMAMLGLLAVFRRR